MKKQTRKTKNRNRILTRNAYRRITSNKKTKQGKRKHTKAFKLRKTELECPQDFSLDSNFKKVVLTLAEIRHQSKIKSNKPTDQVFILLQNIQKISPAGALVLAAEIDNWRHTPRARPLKSVTPPNWDTQVRGLLNDMGFFRLLGQSSFEQKTDTNDIRYVKFRTDSQTDGAYFEELLQEEGLEPIVDEIPDKHRLYAAVTEAMTNVKHHAYSPNQNLANWWLSASYDSEKREFQIVIYDQGNGIPQTLPRKLPQDILSKITNDHAALIEKAHDLGRSASKEEYRGYGLRSDIRGYMEDLKNCCGYYRVISLKGEYTYKRLDNGQTITRKHNHSCPLYGTLIEWKLSLAQ